MLLLSSCRFLGKRVPRNQKYSGSMKIIRRNFAQETAEFETKPYKLHKLTDAPATKATLTKADALHMYTKMQTIRRMETTAGNLYKSKNIRGFCHLYSGQEAIAVGIHQMMKPVDTVITAYRAHGWVYMMGASVEAILSELTGKQGGVGRGKGGSMHLYTDQFFGGNGIVGAQIPLGVGLAFASKYKGTGGVSYALYGDGAANQGQIFEVFNMAKLWDLPCVFVCENNGFGMGTKAERASANTEFYTRGDAVPGIWVDGMDVLTVREAARFVNDYARSGKGPVVMEAATYRYSGHSMSDPGTSYRTRDEIEQVRQTRDPITSFKGKIVGAQLVTEEELKKIDAEIKTLVDEATKKAKADKEIGLDELCADIYSEILEEDVRNVTPFNSLKQKRIGRAINAK